MQMVEVACIGGYWDGNVFWSALDRRYGARKWGCIFAVDQREIVEGGGGSISVRLETFFSGIAAWQRDSSWRNSIPRRRVLLN